MSIIIEECPACSYIEMREAMINGVVLEDRHGHSVAIGKEQAEEVVRVLKHFIKTGELPE